MTSYRIKHFRPQVLVTFLVVLGLLFAGVRVPDLSRPHRPKLTYRAITESHFKTVTSQLKQHNDLAVVVPTLAVASDAVSYPAVARVAPQRYASPPFPTDSGRSPPASPI